MKRRGRKSAAQTPAPKSERIYGSKKNPKGSASSEKSAKNIKLSEKTIHGLENKLAEFRKSHTNKKITLNDLKAVYRRGLGAYSSSHRPTISGGFPNTRNAWAMARVNKFLKKAGGQKVKAAYVQDDDLMKYGDGGDIYNNFQPSVEFDKKYGTSISKTDWEYPDGLTTEEVHDIYIAPLLKNRVRKKDWEKWGDYVNKLDTTHFPYPHLDVISMVDRAYIINGMVSGFNYDDIVYFFQDWDYTSEDSQKERDEIEKELMRIGVQDDDIQWVISPKTLKKIKKQIKDDGGVQTKIVTKDDTELIDKMYDLAAKNINTNGIARIALLENGKLVGASFLEEENLDFEYLFDVVIARGKRNKGYGTILLDAVMEDFKNSGTEQIRAYVVNDKLISILEKKYGFGCEYDDNSGTTICFQKKKYEDGGVISIEKLKKDLKEFSEKEFYEGLTYTELSQSCDLAKGNCYDISEELYDFLNDKGYKDLTLVEVREPLFDLKDAHYEWKEFGNEELFHIILKVGDYFIDFTGVQYSKEDIGLRIFTEKELKKRWGKMSFFDRFAKGGLIAPNGKPSNLTAEQYKLVRTPEFKNWFGDWENDPENASKVVDENGEPLVVYHGTNQPFLSQKFKLKPQYAKHNDIVFFANNSRFAKRYGKNVFEIFINLRKEQEEDILDDNGDWQLNKKKYDGFLISDFGAVGSINQIKLADGTNTTFDSENPDIRFADGGLIAPNGKPSNLTAEQYNLVRTPEFKNWFGDWENDPENASKVVDENGEPLVVYHGSKSHFNIFDLDKGGQSNTLAQVGFWFTPLRAFAKNFASNIWYGEKSFVIVYSTFLNIRNPKIYETSPEKEVVYSVVENGKIYKDGLTMTEAKRLAKELNDQRWLSSPHDDDDEYEVYTVSSNYEKYPDSYEKFKIDIYKLAGQTEQDANIGGLGMALNNRKETINKYRDLLKSENYDGIFILKTRFDRGEAGGLNNQYVALYPEQIKLAESRFWRDDRDINTTFDPNNPDIRYADGGILSYSKTQDPFKNDELKTFGNEAYGDFVLEKIPVKKINAVINGRATTKGFEFDNEDGYHTELLENIRQNINKLPPIIVLENTDGTYTLVDGMHRTTVFNEMGKDIILAWVGKGKLKNFKNGGLIAPNGKPSNLTAEQYKLVRTPEFKAWFGDWENDPESASKIVDENGEPLICFHGTIHDFYTFDEKSIGSTNDEGFYGRGFYFSFQKDCKNQNWALNEAAYYGDRIILSFIRAIKPFDFSVLNKYNGNHISYVGANTIIFLSNLAKLYPSLSNIITLDKEIFNKTTKEYEIIQVPISVLPPLIEKYSKEIKIVVTENEWRERNVKTGFINGDQLKLVNFGFDNKGVQSPTDEQIEFLLICDAIEKYDGINSKYHPQGYMTRYNEISEAIRENHDCILQNEEGDELVVFASNQIKLADGSNTTFDPENPDIRFAKGGNIEDIIKKLEKVAKSKPTDIITKKKITQSELKKILNKIGNDSDFIKYANKYGKKDYIVEKLNSEMLTHGFCNPLAYYLADRYIGIDVYSAKNEVDGNHLFIKFKDKYYDAQNTDGVKYIKELDFFTEKNNIHPKLLESDNLKDIAEEYHKAKKDGSNPDLVKSIEQSIATKFAKGGKTNKNMKGIETRGDCYYIAGQFAMDNIFTPKDIHYIGTPYLVQAEVQGQGAVSHLRYGHAWIEDDENVYDFSNNRELVIPKFLYYTIGDVNENDPKKYRKYTFAEARRKMLDTGHYGCWDLDVEYRDGGEVYAESLAKYDKKHKYLSKLIDNYGDEQRAKDELQWYIGVLNDINENGGEVYRIVSAKDKSKINVNKLGKHWTLEKDNLSRLYENIIIDEGDIKPYLIVANAQKGSVDFENSLDNFTQIPDEMEINFKIQPEVKKITRYFGKGGRVWNDEELLKRYKRGESIGFSGIAHLKAQGLIKRADGTKRKSAEYGAEILPKELFTPAEKDLFDMYDIQATLKAQQRNFKEGGTTENVKVILIPETYQKIKSDLAEMCGSGEPRIAMLDENDVVIGGVFITEIDDECNFDIKVKDEHRHKGHNCLLMRALIKDFHENMNTEMLVCENDFTKKLGWENGCFTRKDAKIFMDENRYKYKNYLHTDAPKIMDEFNSSDGDVTCVNCGWKWNISQSDESDQYVCHKCGFDNTLFYDTNIMNKLKKPMSVPEISDKFNVDEEYVLEQLKKGMEHEMEHTDDEQVAEIIALHHIAERPDYYEVIEEMKLSEGGYTQMKDTMEYDIPEYIENEKNFAKMLMDSDETRKSKAMICKAKINMASQNEKAVKNEEERAAWGQVCTIWKDCFYDVMSGDVVEYEEQECGCGCQTTTYDKGGLAYGNSHDKGGIPLKVESTGQDIEIEGGEGVINKRSMQMTKKLEFEGKEMTPCEIISKINEMGGGVKFKCADVKKIIAEDGNF